MTKFNSILLACKVPTALFPCQLPFYTLILTISIFIGCSNPTKTEFDYDIAHYAKQLRGAAHPYNNAQRIARQKAMLTPRMGQEQLALELGLEQIRSGATEDGITTLDSLILAVSARNKEYDAPLIQQANIYRAMAYLRLGEQQNCILNHSRYSCILPIDSSAVYSQYESANKAITSYLALLKKDPNDFESRYLLNLAHMTLGTYPKAIPKEHRIENPLFTTKQKRIVEDKAMEKNMATVGLAGGVIAEDFNGDGQLDVMTSSWDMDEHIQLFINSGKGVFEEASVRAGLTGIAGGLNMVQTDYNNDGWVDVLILRGGWLGLFGKIPNTLLRNNGVNDNGEISFTDVTVQAGLTGSYPTQTAVWADFNNDGFMDVYIGNESAVTGFKFPSQLFMNNQDGTFSDCAKQAQLEINDTLSNKQYIIKGVTASDYDNDGWMDIFVSTRNDQNFLFRNKGPSNEGQILFEDVTKKSGLAGPYHTFTCWFWDYNNDGFDDILAAGFDSSSFNEGKSISHDFGKEMLGMEHDAQKGSLFKNNGDGTFSDVSKSVGLDKILYMMGGNFGDIDNDGWLDFYCGNGDPDLRSVIPNRMFRFNGTTFEEITNQGFAHIQKGHGIAFADLDHNGNQDIYMTAGGFYQGDFYQNIYFENQLPLENNYITLRLIGKQSNSFGIGSKIKLTFFDGKEKRMVYRRVNSGGSFGASSLVQHIGLGQATSINKLEIFWSGSNHLQTLYNLDINQFYEITETSDK